MLRLLPCLLLAAAPLVGLAQNAEPADAAREPDRAAATAGPRGESVPSPARDPLVEGATIAPATPADRDAEFARLDSNGDGSLSQSELSAGNPAGGYVAIDRDRNGRISPGEFSAFETEVTVPADAARD